MELKESNSRESSWLSHKKWFIAAFLLYVLVAVVGALTVKDYGMSWDELFRFAGGDEKLNYYQKLFAGGEVRVPGSSYPGLFDLPLAIAHEWFPELGTRSEKGHIYSLLFGLAGLLAAWRLTARIGGERAGFWALLLLVATPRYYGHMFMNPKDLPLAATYLCGVWALVSGFSRLPLFNWRSTVWIGVTAGLALSTRIAGFLILCYFGLFALIYLIGRTASRGKAGVSWQSLPVWKDLWFWLSRGLVAGLIALTILFVFWPDLHANPFAQAEKSLGTVQGYGWDGKVLMDGYFWDAENLPFYYMPYWLVRTIPETTLVLSLIGLVLLVLALAFFVRHRNWHSVSDHLPVGILCFAALFPLGYIYWIQPTLYDAGRHFLFLVPPLVCLAALTLEWISRLLEGGGRFRTRTAALILAGLSICPVLLTMWRLHPYQYVYFNSISGGLPAAYMRDETDYWGLSHKEAGEWLNDYVEQIDPDGDRVYKVHQRYTRWMLKESLNPDRFEMWQPRENADFFVSVTRFNLHTSYPEAQLLHVVQREGVPLCLIYSFSD